MKEMLLRFLNISRFVNKTPAPLGDISVDQQNAE